LAEEALLLADLVAEASVEVSEAEASVEVELQEVGK
jgi:hypothetical protein